MSSARATNILDVLVGDSPKSELHAFRRELDANRLDASLLDVQTVADADTEAVAAYNAGTVLWAHDRWQAAITYFS